MIQLLSKYKSYIFSFLLIVGMIFAVNIFAATPERTLGFQGQFYTYNTPGNAPVSATFTFYDSLSGGNVTGTPISKIIQVVNGYFGTTFTEADTTGVDLNQQLYLEISINGTTLSPRTTVNPTVSSLKSFGTFSYAAAPTVGPSGSLYFNSTSQELYVSNGTSWQLAGVASTTIQWTPNGTSLNYMAGNVGIGTTTPESKLSVVDASRSYYTNINGGAVDIKSANSVTPVLQVRSDNGADLLALSLGATRKVTVTNQGLVGIGTSTPEYTIDLFGTGPVVAIRDFQNTGGAGGFVRLMHARGTPAAPLAVQSADRLGALIFQGYDGSAFSINATMEAYVDGAVATGSIPTSLRFFTTQVGAGGRAERMRITNAGFMGLGVTDPDSKLTIIASSTTFANQFTLRSARAALVSGDILGSVDFSSNDTNLGSLGSTTASIVALANTTHTASALGTDLSFRVTNGATSSEALRILGNGNVGIGTSTPETLLHVGGAILAPLPPFPGTVARFVNSSQAPGGIEVYASQANVSVDARILFAANDGSYITMGQPSASNTATLFGLPRSTMSFIFNNAGTAGGATRHMAIGTFDAKDLIFGTTNAERMRILANGNVGIGTTDPTQKTEIKGAAGDPATSGSTQNGILRLSNTALSTSLDFGVSNTGSRYSWLQSTSFSNLSTKFALSLNPNGGNVGIGTTTPGSKLTVAGAINSTDLLGGATTLSTDANGNIIRTPSDSKLKTNVETLTSALDKVNQMRGVSYKWIDENRFGTSTEIGFIAQELETIVPEVVKSGGEYKSVNYQNLTALLTEAIKELSAKVTGFGESFKSKFVEADEVKTKKLCIDDLCITKEELRRMMIQRGSSGNSNTVIQETPQAEESSEAPTLEPEQPTETPSPEPTPEPLPEPVITPPTE